jgi:hypothetical protein
MVARAVEGKTMARGADRRKRKQASKRRPRGVTLSSDDKDLIVAAIEAGSSVEAASRAAGISPRTFRELRQRAYGRHPTRSPLPQLKPFFKDVDKAIGRRLMANEIWVSDNDKKYSLKYLRARLETEDEDEEPIHLPTAQEMQQELDVLISSGAFRVPECPEDCRCPYHRLEGEGS